jgi:hypothetical protein
MERIDQALAFLWQNSRFVSYFYQTVRFAEDKELPTLTLSVHGKRAVLFYNPYFITTLTADETVGLLVHEMLHVVFNHRHRVFQDQNLHLQNLAQDMVINTYIKDRRDRFFSPKTDTRNTRPRLFLPQGLPTIPPDFFEDTETPDPSWEAVYHWLKTRGPKELEAFNQGLKSLFSSDHAARPSDDSHEKAPHMADSIPDPDADESGEAQDVFVFKTPDNQPLPTGAHTLAQDDTHRILSNNLLKAVSLSQRDDTALSDRLFSEINTLITRPRSVSMEPVIRKVKTVVHRFSQSRDWRPTYDRFNRRFFANGIYTPGRSYVNLKTLTVAVDVSASMVTRFPWCAWMNPCSSRSGTRIRLYPKGRLNVAISTKKATGNISEAAVRGPPFSPPCSTDT